MNNKEYFDIVFDIMSGNIMRHKIPYVCEIMQKLQDKCFQKPENLTDAIFKHYLLCESFQDIKKNLAFKTGGFNVSEYLALVITLDKTSDQEITILTKRLYALRGRFYSDYLNKQYINLTEDFSYDMVQGFKNYYREEIEADGINRNFDLREIERFLEFHRNQKQSWSIKS